ncbi:unnamed protein product [Lathyrus sativus]|nr:unnamed protein product [Lathyrus sativus]
MEGYLEVVSSNWKVPLLLGEAMHTVWKKMKNTPTIIRLKSKPISGIKLQHENEREALKEAEMELLEDRIDPRKIDKVKKCTGKVIKWNTIEEQALIQRAKIDWLRLGDGNNAYFQA